MSWSTPPSLAEAAVDADRLVAGLSERSGIRVEGAVGSQFGEVVDLFEATWGVGRSPDSAHLIASSHAGNLVHVARRGDRVVGASFAFLGDEGGIHLHSHMAAVVPDERGRGVGLLLKAAQRATALGRGIGEIRWTYDPVLLVNARFNLARLGGEVAALHPDFYGRLDDAVSGDDASDRVEVSWRLGSERVVAALAGKSPRDEGEEADVVLPADYHALRARDPAEAAATREQVRARLRRALEEGRPIDVVRTGYLIGDMP